MSEDALFTDLYELTMLSTYLATRFRGPAVFEMTFRDLPPPRGFLVAAGLDQLLDYLERFRIHEPEIESLARSGGFDPTFLQWLRDLRFTGDVDAVPEGTVVFANEPVVRVTAPLPEAQILETRLINLLHLQTMIASKAARAVLIAPGKQLVDFGARRAHGLEAGILAARAAYVAGFAGTSIVLAGLRFGIPLMGTMAHSFVEAYDDEMEAFRAFVQANPGGSTVLIDTYDTEAAAHKVVRLARQGLAIQGVRIDSGDLLAHARQVRRILDDGGLTSCAIFASGGLDETSVRDLVTAGAPIDGFGIGTRLDTSADAPYLEGIYKLQEYAGRPRRKRSEGKATWPGRKQVFREVGPPGWMVRDTVTTVDDTQPGQPLLVPVMRDGRRVAPPEALEIIRRRTAEQLRLLPPHLRALDVTPAYPVRIAPALQALARH